MGTALRVVLFLLVVLLITGCPAITGYPNRSTNAKRDLHALASYSDPTVITNYSARDDSARGGKTRRQYRDEVVNGRLTAIDIQFNLFQEQLYEQGIGAGILTDWLVLALGGATTVIGTAVTKAALGAAITGVTGAKVAFDKHVYFNQTLPALLTKMQAQRKEVLVLIRAGLHRDDAEYPLTQALGDLEHYFNVGTIPGVIVSIAESAGAQAKKADEDLKIVLDIARDKSFLEKSNTARIEVIVNKIPSLSDGAAIVLNQNPPTQDPKSEAVIQEQDKRNQRFVNGNAARQALLLRAQIDHRNEENLSAWEKALGLR